MKKIIYLIILLFGMQSFSQGVLWEEDFEANTIPSDWTTWGSGGVSEWSFGTGDFPWTDYTTWNFDNNAAIFSDYTADEDSHNVRILARTEAGVDATNFTNLKLEFYGSLRTSGTYGNGELIVLVFDQSTNSWRHMATYTSDIITTDIVLNLETYMNTYPGIDRSDLRVGFKYDDLNHGITYGAGIAWVKITGNPINDTCSAATVVPIQEEQSTWLQDQKIIGASNNNGGVDACNNGTYDGIWYTFTPTHSWKMDVHVFPLYNSFVEVYSGSCNNLSCVNVTRVEGINDLSASYIFDAVAGTQYWVNLGVTGYSQNDYYNEPFTNSFDVLFGYEKPDNDNRNNAVTINNFPYSNTQSIDATTNNDDTTTNGFVTVCYPGMNDGVWYDFYAPANGEINIEALAGQVDLEIGLYELTDPNEETDFTNYSCTGSADSHGFGTAEHLIAQVEAGKRYMINIGDYSDFINHIEEGDLTINVYYSEPDNNNCGQAEELTFNQTIQGTTAGANASITTCGNTANDIGVWYHFTSTYGGVVTLEITNSTNGSYNENLAVFTGNCSNLVCDFNFDENNPYAEFETQINAEYYVYVSTFSDSIASFDITLNGIPPENDEATGAIEIPVNNIGVACTNPTIVYNANGVTDSSPINSTPSCASYAGGDSWYKFVAPTSGGIKINRPNNGDWGALGYAIYDSETSITPLTCGFIATGSTVSNNITGLTAGNYYWLRLWEWNNNDFGSVGICLTAIETAGYNDLTQVNIQVYPNPVQNILHIQADEPIAKISIFSLLGQQVYTKETSKNKENIDISALTEGAYFIKIQIKNKEKTYKIIKTK